MECVALAALTLKPGVRTTVPGRAAAKWTGNVRPMCSISEVTSSHFRSFGGPTSVRGLLRWARLMVCSRPRIPVTWSQ